MICADTSSFVAVMQGGSGRDVELVVGAMRQRGLVLAPASVAELLSDPGLPPAFEGLVLGTPQLEITTGYWERAGRLRAQLMRHRFRPKLADTLIAQSCLDHDALLVSRDRNFYASRKLAGLRLVTGDRVQ
jgi:predicted nucleic acid-binding protein